MYRVQITDVPSAALKGVYSCIEAKGKITVCCSTSIEKFGHIAILVSSPFNTTMGPSLPANYSGLQTQFWIPCSLSLLVYLKMLAFTLSGEQTVR